MDQSCGGSVGAEHVRCPTQSQYGLVLSGDWRDGSAQTPADTTDE